MPNRLANETSPYLLQHKDNPVDWYPWGDEAFEKARNEDLPVFLSVGYSACHWCHVMERESFEDEAVATLLNERYVAIKVDREERPDVDSIYMSAVQAMTGSGGWPMSVFLTPDAKPYFAGTYFPPEDRGHLPSFTRVLQTLANAYQSKKAEILSTASDVVDHLAAYNEPHANASAISRSVLTDGIESFKETFDPENGGFGVAPKFPQPLLYEFLLRMWADTGDAEILKMVETTLTRMARGGVYDQIGGGFHRYSVDSVWLVPHFEKMLYDNALLAPLFLHTYQATGDVFYRDIAQDILSYAERELLHPDGGFYSAQDADSEGEEGKFFTWTAAEFALSLGEDLGISAAAYWGASAEGNFEGKNILWTPRADEDVARELGITAAELRENIRRSRDLLFKAREKRVKPALDDKVLTSWNALMQKAFAEAGAILGRKDYVEIAVRNAEFLETRLESEGRLLRTWKDGAGARIKGYLEDYAFQIDGLITLHEATFDARWLRRAVTLANSMIDLFWDEESGVFYDTGVDHEQLLIRPRNIFDNAQPSGSSVAVASLLKMTLITGDDMYRKMAESAMKPVSNIMRQAPGGVPVWMGALDFQSSTPLEIAVFGDPNDPETRKLLDVIHGEYWPNKVIVGASSASNDPASPLLEGRDAVDGNPTVYVCENYACQLPATEPLILAGQLAR